MSTYHLVVFRLNLSPVRLKLISSPSGINLHSSFNFFADVVVFPDDLTLDNGPLVVTSDSKSVAVNLKVIFINLK